MKTKIGVAVAIAIVLIVVTLAIMGLTLKSTAPTLLNVLQPGEYVEYRCLDVSNPGLDPIIDNPDYSFYTTFPWVLDSVDADGCDVVKRQIVEVAIKSHYSTNSFTFYDDEDEACKNLYGEDWNSVGTYYRSNNIYSGILCGRYGYQFFGGSESVVNTCDYDPNDILAAETFSSGDTIDKFDTRYPVKSFCRAHPAIFTDNSDFSSITDTTVYQGLQDGSTFTVPQGQTMTLFYIMENNNNLPTNCNTNQAVNVDSQNCVPTTGFAYLCSRGNWDANLGICVIEDEAQCENGRFEIVDGQERCVYNPPEQAQCSSDRCFYSVDREVCSCLPEEVNNCRVGFEFSEPETASQCSIIGGAWDLCPQCPQGEICPESLCTPKCSLGQVCSYVSPAVQSCEAAGSPIMSDGTCEIDGDTIQVCPTDSDWDPTSRTCEQAPDKEFVCEDGTFPSVNPVTGRLECEEGPVTYLDCDDGEIPSNGKCVDRVQIYDPNTNSFIISERTSASNLPVWVVPVIVLLGGSVLILMFVMFIVLVRSRR